MENATKALTMAASILIGILIITLMFILFRSGAKAGHRGDKETERIAIEQFNVNFTKYLGKDLTVYDVVSICNYVRFCKEIKNRTVQINGQINGIDSKDFKANNINDYTNEMYKFQLKITNYEEKWKERRTPVKKRVLQEGRQRCAAYLRDYSAR